jgi:MFS family permease
MVTAMLAASQVDGVWPTLALVMIANFGVCFLWPPMEALMSEGEPPSRLQGLVGLYSCSWAGCSALAYFSGGAILDHYDLRSIFFVPSGIFVGLLFFLFWFERQVKRQPPLATVDQHPLLHAVGGDSASPIAPATFLKMAWLANPMAYLLINTVVSTIPSLAQRYHFNSTQAGFACSAWLFARAASFFLLRLWPNWHYRFRFLAIGYGAMVISFAAMLIVQNLVVLIISQLVLGLTVGLMYYSSLFYSMDVGETKGEHGGIHESAIGLGSGTGPAVAALALWVFPNHSASGAIGVCGILLVGFATLMWMRFQRPAKPKSRF